MPLEILAAEDDAGEACLLQEAFELHGNHSRLHVVRDGVELMAFLRRQGEFSSRPRPDVILLDLNMPRKGGFTALAEIKSDRDLSRIPVVVFSSSTADSDVSQCYALHANSYLVKPGDLQGLIRCVELVDAYWSQMLLPTP
jgi:two-component system response regulator